MSAIKELYNIPFRGLKNGIHSFDFTLDNQYFEYFKNPDCLGGEVVIDIEFNKKDNLLTLTNRFKGRVKVLCDRCLDEFFYEVNFSNALFVKFGEEESEADADIIFLDPADSTLELAHYFLESIVLELPIKRVHKRDKKGEGCNREMLKYLDKVNFSEDKEFEPDPRWNTLKNIDFES